MARENMSGRSDNALLGIILASLLAFSACDGPSVTLGPIMGLSHETAMEEAVLKAVNAARLREGIAALKPDAALQRLAWVHTRDMVRMRKLTHRGRDRLQVDGRADRMGIDYREIGENVGRNREFKDPAAKAVLSWMASKGHRAGILNGKFTLTGIGAARCSDGYVYLTQVFMQPMPPAE